MDINVEKTLKEEDLKIAMTAVSSFRIAMSNIRLYPSNSSIVSNSISDVFGKFQNLINIYTTLTYAVVSGNIIVNGSIVKNYIKQYIKRLF